VGDTPGTEAGAMCDGRGLYDALALRGLSARVNGARSVDSAAGRSVAAGGRHPGPRRCWRRRRCNSRIHQHDPSTPVAPDLRSRRISASRPASHRHTRRPAACMTMRCWSPPSRSQPARSATPVTSKCQ